MIYDEENRTARSIRPFLYSFITLRPERFGAFIFNPYLGVEEELDPVEAYVGELCNGHNSFRQVETLVQRRFGLLASETENRVVATMEKMEKLSAIAFKEGTKEGRPRLPDAFTFAEDEPPISAPKSVIWDVTYACNLRCPHCLTASGKASRNELNTLQALLLIDKLAEAKVFNLSLSGGEPLLRPDILQLLHRATATNMRVDIATNGVELPEKILHDLQNMPIFNVQVSIDGIKTQHDRLRGLTGAFDAVCRTIDELKGIGIAVSLSTTVSAQNVGTLDKIIDFAAEMGCSGFKAIPFLPAGRGRANAKWLKLDKNGHARFTKTLIERRSELQGTLNISLESCFHFLLEPPPTHVYQNGPIACSAGYDTLSIGADGTAYPCPFLHDFPLGNLLRHPIKSIWKQAPVLQVLRSIQKTDLPEPCKDCRYCPVLCHGGCRAAAYLECGDLRAADPTCFSSAIQES